MPQQRVAVVGSGIAGLGSAYLLHKAGHAVTLYEREPTCGGHTLTDETEKGSQVDLGFQVFNLTNYPHLVKLFDELGVDSDESEMSFSLSLDGGNFEWASHGLASIFAQASNAASPSFLCMIADMLRFNSRAPSVLNNHAYRNVSLGQYLRDNWYSAAFADKYLLPMCAAIWSVPSASCLNHPVQTVVAFMNNHHMLQLFSRPQWRVVRGRSRTYVDKIVAQLPDVRTSTAVSTLERTEHGVLVHDEKGGREMFDKLVMATHTDVSLRLLGEGATDAERAVLGAIPYQDNDIYLHKDASLMPRRRSAWASWNVLAEKQTAATDENSQAAPVCVTYWVNSLQRVEDGIDRFVTLNPIKPPEPSTVIRRLTLAHPSFSFAARTAQEQLPALQGQNHTWFCGAWCGWGFHEDGLKSAVAVADSMGTPPAWVARSLSPTIPVMDSLALRVFEQAASRVIKKGALRVVLPNGRELFFGQKQMQRPPRSTATTLGQIPLKAEHGDAPVHVTLRVFDTNFFVRAIKGMDVGLGEAYMYGEYDVDNLTNWVLLLTHNIGAIDEQLGRGMLGLASTIGSTAQSLYHKSRINSITGSRKNIHEHYDLGNDMYKLFLDDTMTYSAGIFRKPDDSLKQSQYNKLDALLAKAKVQKDHHVLEIGCGWGSMAIRAAQTIGCRVTGVTISDEQFGEAKARVAAAGLETLVNIVFLDYRELPNKYGPSFFDAAVSCEMIEAVGHEHLPIYFGVLNTMVKPGGRVAIQAITSQDHKYEGQLQGCDFIKRHIFPGSVLPSMQVMKEVTHGQTFLRMDEKEDIGLDYATTLRLWHEAWIEQESAVKALGYDDIFFRKWRFYFSYCEAAFAAQYIYDFQISWLQTKPATAATGTNSTPEQQSHTSSPSSLSWVRDHLAKPKAISPWLLLLVLVCALCWPQIVTSLQQ